MAVLEILLGFLACAATALSFGLTLLRLLGVPLFRGEAVCIGYVVGAACASTLTLAIAACWIAWKAVFLVVGGASMILLWCNLSWLRSLKRAPRLDASPALRLLFCIALVAYGVLYFRQALSPEMSPDGMAYHLGLVNLWNHAHGLEPNTGMHAALPEGMEMLFLFAFSIGRHSAAALVHYSFLMVLPCLMVLCACRFGWPGRATVLAAILVLASPLVGVDGTSAYNDVALATTVVAIVLVFEVWRRQPTTGALMSLSLLTGFALTLKYTAAFLAIFVVAAIFWQLRRTPRRAAARTLLIAIVVIAALPAPYLIRNALWFQNPIAFFGNGIFPNRWFHVSFERSYAHAQAHLRGVTWSEMPRELTFGGSRMQESFGPAFLLLPAALIGLAWPRTRFLLLAALAAALPFAAVKSARFLIPALPLVTMAAAFVISRLPRSGLLAAALALTHLVVSWPSLNNRLHFSAGWRIAYHVSWPVALRQDSEERFLERADQYRMARLVETGVPQNEPVLSLDDSIAQSYTLHPILVAWESAAAERMSDMILSAGYAPSNGSRAWTAAFPATRARELRIVQTAAAAGEALWSINEIRIWSEGAPVPASAFRHLDAHPNPWDVALAFDGSEATRWRSWEALRPGMSITVRLDRSRPIDRIEVVCHDPQWEAAMAASILTESGEWQAAAQSAWRAIPTPDLRRDATRQLARSGVRFLEMRHDRWRAEPFRADAAGWGVQPVASTRDSILLRVD